LLDIVDRLNCNRHSHRVHNIS